MLPLEDQTRLQHMLDAALAGVESVEGWTQQDLMENQLTALGLVKCIEIIGEAAANISDTTQQNEPQLPWQAMRGMRNRLVHAYFEIDFAVVWITVTESLPLLIEQLTRILDREKS